MRGVEPSSGVLRRPGSERRSGWRRPGPHRWCRALRRGRGGRGRGGRGRGRRRPVRRGSTGRWRRRLPGARWRRSARCTPRGRRRPPRRTRLRSGCGERVHRNLRGRGGRASAIRTDARTAEQGPIARAVSAPGPAQRTKSGPGCAAAAEGNGGRATTTGGRRSHDQALDATARSATPRVGRRPSPRAAAAPSAGVLATSAPAARRASLAWGSGSRSRLLCSTPANPGMRSSPCRAQRPWCATPSSWVPAELAAQGGEHLRLAHGDPLGPDEVVPAVGLGLVEPRPLAHVGGEGGQDERALAGSRRAPGGSARRRSAGPARIPPGTPAAPGCRSPWPGRPRRRRTRSPSAPAPPRHRPWPARRRIDRIISSGSPGRRRRRPGRLRPTVGRRKGAVRPAPSSPVRLGQAVTRHCWPLLMQSTIWFIDVLVEDVDEVVVVGDRLVQLLREAVHRERRSSPGRSRWSGPARRTPGGSAAAGSP